MTAGAEPADDLADGALPAGRKWLALAIAGIIATLSSWSWVLALIGFQDDSEFDFEIDPTPWMITAIVLAPVVFFVLVWMTRSEDRLRFAAIGMLLLVVVGYFTLAITLDPATHVTAGFGAGAAYAVPLDPGHRKWGRIWTVGLTALYVLLFTRLILAFSLVIGPMLAFVSIGLGDMIVERRVARTAGDRSRPRR